MKTLVRRFILLDSALSRTSVSFNDAVKVWLKVGFLSFGGPAGQIALMHRILIEEKQWISEERFLHALNYCMLLPGPEAQQLAIYVGWLMHGTVGGLVAGTLFVVPGALLILALSALYASYAAVPMVAALFAGVKAAVLVIVVEAVLRIGKRALGTQAAWLIAACAFVALFALNVPFPMVVVAAGLTGVVAGTSGRESDNDEAANPASAFAIDRALDAAPAVKVSWSRTVTVSAIGLLLWLLPLIVLSLSLGVRSLYTQQFLLFTKLAVVTFGGAYAALSYIAQEAVQNHHWLSAEQMMDGLGLAETTPGPLILVLQFVAFMAAYQHAGAGHPLLGGVVASLLMLWATFVPCFLWIFVGAPYIENLRSNKRLRAALTAITAAVVGVVLNLALWFGLHVMFGTVNERTFGMIHLPIPDVATIRPVSIGLSLLAAIAMFRFRISMLVVLVACAVAGLILSNWPIRAF
jgi:chromate transporter